MKKIAYFIFAFFALVLLALVAVPYLFKDKIFDKLDQELAKSVNATVYYDRDKVSLSVFRNFPSLSAGLGDFGVKGNPPFQNDTLVHVGELQVDLDIWSVIFSENPSLKGIRLQDGQFYIKVLADGKANYDIMFESEEGEPVDTTSSNFQLGIDLIEIENLDFIYDDRSLDFLMVMSAMDFVGSGDLTLDVYDLMIKGEGNIVNVAYEGVEYLSNKSLAIDSKINVDLKNMKFGVNGASLKLNDFGFGIDGFLAMPGDDIEMDAKFYGKDNDFKSALSLVPGVYSASFDDLKTSGEMDFSGALKGTYSETSFPAFQFGLVINEGMFQYPDLPRPVQHVNMELKVVNETGDLDYTAIDLSRFSLEFGDQPVSGRFMVKDLINYEMDGQLIGKLDLLELTSIFPIEDMELKGQLAIDATAKGRYDSVAEIIPVINAKIELTNGHVKSAAYPAPIDNINVRAIAANKTGKMNDFAIDVPTFGFDLEGEKINGALKLNDLTALNYDFSIHGAVDLGKIVAIVPMEDILLEGKIKADLDAKGSYEAIEANRFGQLDTKGELLVNDFYYADKDYPQGVRINEASANFSPKAINLVKMDARLGKSPVQATGTLSNYMAFLLSEEGSNDLQGSLDIYSSSFDVNEWMTGAESASEDTTALEVVALPDNIDFTMSVKADKIYYDNLTLNNASGKLWVKDAVLKLEGFKTDMLGGSLVFDGTYNSKDISKPSFDMTLDISKLGVQDAFRSFVTVQTFAPIAQHVTGIFSTKFSFSGLLGQDMMPVLSSLDGSGLIRLAETALKDSPLVKGITSLTKLEDTATISLKPLNITARIEDGMLNIPPFELNLWDYPAKIQGSTGFDGRINYLVNIDVPASKFGSKINGLVAGLVGTDLSNTNVPLAFNIGGSYARPNIGMASSESLEAYISNALKSKVSGQKEDVKDKITADFKAKEDSLKQEFKEKSEVAKDSVVQEATKIIDQTKEKAVDEVKNLLKGFTNRKKTTETEKPTPE
ncbi:AsmA-like C-terminal region-containing protein [uncultured Cyclobacterium sp.]|uniref:AsmA-like C-terminal region-containing protein n=1 Tax=uncultured Cyclobacterium sp. TaxID=453820 RepID=UPI0030ED15C9|tara:strand:+ start:140442 stop:143447 length:3006 start_codon:yes stop_codon:yes gene_type:complete